MRRKAPDFVRLGFISLFISAASLCCCGTHPEVSAQAVPELQSPRPKRLVSLPRFAGPEFEHSVAAIASLRGWSPELPVDVLFASRDMIADSMLADAHAQMPTSVQQAQSQFLAAFGWVPVGFDMERDLLRRFASDVTGLYCVADRRILLSERTDRRLTSKVLRHELVHAFQDARYGLGERTRWHTDRGDYIAAIHSLAEGEATCIERALDDPEQRGCLSPAMGGAVDAESMLSLDSFPPVLGRSLVAPYSDGIRYVQRLLRQGGWAALDAAWNGGLLSTRQLLQDQGVGSIQLPMVPMPSEMSGCRMRYLDSIGQQGVMSLLGESGSTGELGRAAMSLVGDRVAFWRCDGACVAAMRLRFAEPRTAFTFGQWLSRAVGVGQARPEAQCRSFPQRATSYYARGQDIAIVSVLACHGQIVASWGDRCPSLTQMAVHVAGF